MPKPINVGSVLVDAPLLRRTRCIADAAPDQVAKSGSCCSGALEHFGAGKLTCGTCSAEYEVIDGVPQLVKPAVSAGDGQAKQYDEDETIRTYYEMHFAPFLGEALVAKGSESVGSAPPTPLDRIVGDLWSQAALTEPFYNEVLSECEKRKLFAEGVALDVGCGLGRMTAEMAGRGAEYVIGIDYSKKMVGTASRLLSQEGAHAIELNRVGNTTAKATLTLSFRRTNFGFSTGDAQRLPVRNASIDFALCLNLIDRVTDPSLVISELARVLVSGGAAFVSDPYHWEARSTPDKSRWTDDMSTLFAATQWDLTQSERIDGLPFVVRGSSRRIIVYRNDCVIVRKR